MTRLPPMRIRRLDSVRFVRTRVPSPIVTRLQPSSVIRTALPPMRRLKPLGTPVKGTARPQVRRSLDIEHLIVTSQLRGLPLHAKIERGGQQGGDQAGDGEGGEGFVETADHDARVVVPGDGGTAVAEGPAEVPGEQGESEDPEEEEGEVGDEVMFGV